MIPHALCVALILRSLSLLLPHTFFQPDEFYQALEPAYNSVLGRGFLTWEWRDLPNAVVGVESSGLIQIIQHAVGEGRLRSWVWPGIFILVYRLTEICGLNDTEWVVGTPNGR